jgi:hypothetical protein
MPAPRFLIAARRGCLGSSLEAPLLSGRSRLLMNLRSVHWVVVPFPGRGSVQWLAHATAHVILARRQIRPAGRRPHPCVFSVDPIQGGAGLRPAAACVSHAAGQDGPEDWRARVNVIGQCGCCSNPSVVHWHNEPFLQRLESPAAPRSLQNLRSNNHEPSN